MVDGIENNNQENNGNENKNQGSIKIVKDGPYLVSGNVPLLEKIIAPVGNVYEYVEGRTLPQSEEYALCRCGKSKNPPFCDGAHIDSDFDGTEIASREKYEDRADFRIGADLDLMDDHRCCFARFCHQEDGKVWEMVKYSDRGKFKKQAIQGASACPTGRLTAVEKNGNRIEPVYEPSIIILQDQEKSVSSGIFVRGGIPIEAEDGYHYEVRNRVVLCRCGASRNKPYCDATHILTNFSDKE